MKKATITVAITLSLIFAPMTALAGGGKTKPKILDSGFGLSMPTTLSLLSLSQSQTNSGTDN